jgi:hypothetical protein
MNPLTPCMGDGTYSECTMLADQGSMAGNLICRHASPPLPLLCTHSPLHAVKSNPPAALQHTPLPLQYMPLHLQYTPTHPVMQVRHHFRELLRLKVGGPGTGIEVCRQWDKQHLGKASLSVLPPSCPSPFATSSAIMGDCSELHKEL